MEDDLAGRSTAQAFVAEGGARDIATQAFEFLPLLGATLRVGMQAKPLGPDTALWLRLLLTGKAQRGVWGGNVVTQVLFLPELFVRGLGPI